MLARVAVAAATATIGFDIFGNTIWQIHDRPRVMRRLGLVGSAVIGDTVIDVFYGMRKIGQLSNTTAGASKEPADSDMKWTLGNEVVPVGTPLHFIVVTAPLTNQIVIVADFAEI